LAVIGLGFEPSGLFTSKTYNMNAGCAPFNDMQVGINKQLSMPRLSMLSDSPNQGVEKR
jgi:hypothetical protein